MSGETTELPSEGFSPVQLRALLRAKLRRRRAAAHLTLVTRERQGVTDRAPRR